MKEFTIRGQTESGNIHTINFSGHKGDYAFRLIELSLYPSTAIGSTNVAVLGTITAGKVAVAPTDVNFNDEGLIGSSLFTFASAIDGDSEKTVLNDTFLITQDLLLMVQDVTTGNPINWQVRFMPVKMTSTELANANYKQFSIFDD